MKALCPIHFAKEKMVMKLVLAQFLSYRVYTYMCCYTLNGHLRNEIFITVKKGLILQKY